MRRSASEIIRNLESRIARLERNLNRTASMEIVFYKEFYTRKLTRQDRTSVEGVIKKVLQAKRIHSPDEQGEIKIIKNKGEVNIKFACGDYILLCTLSSFVNALAKEEEPVPIITNGDLEDYLKTQLGYQFAFNR